jgi:hypothetical protein
MSEARSSAIGWRRSLGAENISSSEAEIPHGEAND